MRRGILGIGMLSLAIMLVVSAITDTNAADRVGLNHVRRQYAPPPMGRKEGLLAVTNRDWQDYALTITRKGRMTIYRGDSTYAGYTNYRIPPGTTVYIALEKDTWEISSESTSRLKVKVREGRTSTLSLNPFGYVGNTGLTGISNDGDKTREEVLFNNFTRPVVVQRPTVVVPPPPPTIVTRPPVVVVDPPRVYHVPPPPRRHHGGDSWGFSFGFNR